jgi:hypothetical protein
MEERMPDKWEYKTLFLQDLWGWTFNNAREKRKIPDLEKELCDLGQAGWELVTSAPYQSGWMKLRWLVLILKRRIASSQ